MRNSIGATALLVWIAFGIGCLYGWIHNIVLLFGAVDAAITVKTALRIVGIFVPPLGVVLGYID